MIIARKLFKLFLLYIMLFSVSYWAVFLSTEKQFFACLPLSNCFECLLQQLFKLRDSSRRLLNGNALCSYLSRFLRELLRWLFHKTSSKLLT